MTKEQAVDWEKQAIIYKEEIAKLQSENIALDVESKRIAKAIEDSNEARDKFKVMVKALTQKVFSTESKMKDAVDLMLKTSKESNTKDTVIASLKEKIAGLGVPKG